MAAHRRKSRIRPFNSKVAAFVFFLIQTVVCGCGHSLYSVFLTVLSSRKVLWLLTGVNRETASVLAKSKKLRYFISAP